MMMMMMMNRSEKLAYKLNWFVVRISEWWTLVTVVPEFPYQYLRYVIDFGALLNLCGAHIEITPQTKIKSKLGVFVIINSVQWFWQYARHRSWI